MSYPMGGIPVWFGMGRQKDAQLLRAWRDAPVTYFPDQDIDPSWNMDRYEVVLGIDSTGDLFQRAAALTLYNQFYPVEVMEAVSDFSLAGRTVRAGDRVLQRIRVFQSEQMPILEILTMNEITEVIQEPRRAGFTYTTTAAHSEVGEWSPTIEWRENNEVILLIEVVSSTRAGASAYLQRFTRKMQLRAHKLSIAHFIGLLNGQRRAAARRGGIPRLIPAAVLTIALLAFINKAWGYLDRYASDAGSARRLG